MTQKAFQDYYPDDLSHCYGCGRRNEHGLQIKSYWDGEESVCIHQPKSCYMAIPGMAYGGLIASLIDCHSMGTAAAAHPFPDSLFACELSFTHTARRANRSSRKGQVDQRT